MSERALFCLHQRIGLPVVTLRPLFVYGPGSNLHREAFFRDRLRANRSIILPGDGRRLVQFVYVKDLVKVCLKVMDEPAVIGHPFNIAHARPLSQAELVEAFAKVCQKTVKSCASPATTSFALEAIPWARSSTSATTSTVPPITQVTAKALRVLKFKPTDFATGLKETYKWYLRHNLFPKSDYTFEDQLLATAPVLVPAKV